MITKVLQDLEAEENIVRQAKSSIKSLDKQITKMQNSFIRFLDILHTISAIVIRSIISAV